MGLSYEWVDWHLTPGGWLRGSERMDFTPETDVAPPRGRVLTVRYSERVASMGAQMTRYLQTRHMGENWALIEQLLERYGRCPRQL